MTIEYDNIIHIPEQFEMIYLTLNLTKYRKAVFAKTAIKAKFLEKVAHKY